MFFKRIAVMRHMDCLTSGSKIFLNRRKGTIVVIHKKGIETYSMKMDLFFFMDIASF